MKLQASATLKDAKVNLAISPTQGAMLELLALPPAATADDDQDDDQDGQP